ncbi:VanZ family protein [Paenibacillus sp. JDR-2]|uniref:VanZ family protein n=1 Tax=Paenibacillus sp. (strain JDR-2) TaxID=324057 RepID=UPI0001668721|nr:VanZ family protein [Paenibacillus sp. JDR-2]ACT01433.1 VanZ family protein [Paenibacillus sp. JDR-2]
MQKVESNRRLSRPVHVFILILFILYSLIMIKLLFIRDSSYRWSVYNYNIVPFHTIKSLIYHRHAYNTDTWVKNLFGNIVLFIPLGVCFPLLSRRLFQAARSLAAIIILLFLVESIQLVTKVGSFDVDDIILNTLGACIGLVFIKLFASRLRS